ncbi:hypothetical protein COLSTE_01470 [Collinsella stercoris DSM 13279]|uniref:Uncharacterized protein n=1 Tax=Collinsella stercoris DSM 13279 TaxID=445975 RepID=B6GBL0_9ACTN|nr:hypothetical protein COLSTE_01470 [Collinsella stercoris DSM 13279]
METPRAQTARHGWRTPYWGTRFSKETPRDGEDIRNIRRATARISKERS